MDGASRRGAAARGRRPAQRTKRSAQNGGAEGGRRRVIQLVVSLALFAGVHWPGCVSGSAGGLADGGGGECGF